MRDPLAAVRQQVAKPGAANPNAFARWDLGPDGLELRKKKKFDLREALNALVSDAVFTGGMDMAEIAQVLSRTADDIVSDIDAERDSGFPE